jgi:chromatin segregation and condensation protein Rec8/ScpA/Scc1 (kleisin family)
MKSSKIIEGDCLTTKQSVLDKWFLRQDIINQLLESGEESESAAKFAERIMPVVEAEESEYQSLEDPFDRSVALVLSLVKDQELNPWDVDLSTFLKVFTKRVRLESDKLNLPACGRLIRMSWEVLNQQAIVLFDRVQSLDQEDDWEDEVNFGWESDYDDQDYLFTASILDGDVDEILPSLFDERIRRDEGRPVTLGELLSAFKDAADDAEELKIREENRIAHQAELGEYLNNVGGRMHNEDLEGDIFRCWTALRRTCEKYDSSKVKVIDVISELGQILEQENGIEVQGYDEEAKVASFIASLFLTHRGFALISQDEVPYGDIMLEDLWPNIGDFDEINLRIEEKKRLQSDANSSEETGSVQFAKKRAEKLRLKEEKERIAKEQELALQESEALEEHDWLVE